jgi:hypothetical protein
MAHLTRWLSQLLEDITKRGKSWQGIEKYRLWEDRRDGKLFIL